MNTSPPLEVVRVGQIEVFYLFERVDTNGALAAFGATVTSGFTPRGFAPDSLL